MCKYIYKYMYVHVLIQCLRHTVYDYLMSSLCQTALYFSGSRETLLDKSTETMVKEADLQQKGKEVIHAYMYVYCTCFTVDVCICTGCAYMYMYM